MAVQQIFSLIRQSPSGALRLAELAELFAGMLARADLEAILANLGQRGYLGPGRPGEWRPGPRLNKLLDAQGRPYVELSIYSNIQSSAGPLVEVRDRNSGQTVARVDPLALGGDALTLEGRSMSITWADGEAVWVDRGATASGTARPVYRSARPALSYELARTLPAQLGLPPGGSALVRGPVGWLWFHWLGDLYGQALLGLLRYRVAAAATALPGLALQLPDEPQAPPEWDEARVARYLRDNYRQYEPLLDLGPFQQLLPPELRRRAVVEQFAVPRFLAAVAALQPAAAPEQLSDDIVALLGA